MISLSFGLFLLGIFTLAPFITWVVRTTAIPEEGYGGSHKSVRISESFKQLFTMTPNPTSWAVVMSLMLGLVCFIYSVILAVGPIEKTIDFVLAIILVVIIIPSIITFISDVNYMQTDMYKGSLQRLSDFFKTWNYRYLAWIANPLIFGFSVVGTMVSTLTFLYVAYYLVARQPLSYTQIAGKRRW